MFTEATPSSEIPRAKELVHTLTDEQLDALPYGVIALDDAGVVLRYNLYESQLARLDRNAVLGRSFFDEIARCTRTNAFRGRFLSLLDAPPGTSFQFDYLFDFAFGAQAVDVEMIRAPVERVVYVLVQRRRIDPPRADFPRELLAVQQAELAPAEGRLGVRRDARERRVVETPYTFLAALRATCELLAPQTWPIFANEWGVQWGRRLSVELEAQSLERTSASLGDITMREAAAAVSEQLGELGFGALTFDFALAHEGLIRAELTRSALAEATRRAAPDARSCHLVAGCLAGVLSSIAQRKLAGRELRCAAAPGDACELLVLAHERRGLLDRALNDGARDLDTVRKALRARPSGERLQ